MDEVVINMPGLFRSSKKERQLLLSASCRADGNFNLKSKVAQETAIANEIMLRPSNKVIDAVQEVSNIVLALINNKDTQLETHLGQESNLAFLELYMGTQSGYLGTGADKKGMIIWLKKILNTPVSQKNIIDHLTIVNKIGCIFQEVSMRKRKVSKKSFATNKHCVQSIMRLKHPDHKNIELEAAHKLFISQCNYLFPLHENMSAIRFSKFNSEVKHDGQPGKKEPRKHEATKVAGILPLLSPLQHPMIKSHKRGADYWRVDHTLKDSKFINDAIKHKQPLISGASGTTARWLALLELINFQQSNVDLFKIYTSIMPAYMSYCDHHSMHEAAFILKKVGIDYKIGDYQSYIPETVISHARIALVKRKAIEKANKIISNASEQVPETFLNGSRFI